jgi:Peptidase family S41
VGRRVGHVLLLAFLVGTRIPSLSAQNTNGDSARIARLAALGRVFGVVKYFHPAFLHRDVPWDSITIVGIGQVNRATTADEYGAAVRGMLAQLHDPATYVRKTSGEQGAHGTPPKPAARWEVDGQDSTLVISIPLFDEFPSSLQRGEGEARLLLDSVAATVRRARRVIFDLRGPRSDEWGVSTFAFAGGMNETLSATSLTLPDLRMRMHEGYRAIGCHACDAWDGMYEKSGEIINGNSSVPDAVRRTVFIANSWSDIPPVAFALRRAGHGAIVVDGSAPELAAGATTFRVSLGDGLEAVIRTSELADLAATADTAVSGEPGADAPMRVAMAYTSGSLSTVARTPAPLISVPPDDPYSAMRYPAFPYRVLAAYRLWNAINFFYPYKYLIGEDWGATLPRSMGWVGAARDSVEYGLALQRMAVATHDSHSGVGRNNPGLRQLIGPAAPAVQLQYIDGQPVVTTIGDDSAMRASGLAVGDVVVSVDGLTAPARRARFAEFISHSTPQALDAVVSRLLLRGPDSSMARLTVRDRSNRIRRVDLPRRAAFAGVWRFARPTPILRMLPGNIGYADLTRLTAPMVDSMFEMFRHTRGIIFDDRGYPHETGWSIAPRLTDRSMVPVGQWRRPLVMSPDTLIWDMTGGTGYTAPTSKWKYHGKTVVLVNEYAVSQAESLIMLLMAVNNTTVIGSPVMGANGDVVAVPLPGGMFGNFAEDEGLRANGQQWQRIGVQPQILIRPTIEGIRAGRDEVLERAIRFLNE